jgi:predicted RNase H-like HicB family nuclease
LREKPMTYKIVLIHSDEGYSVSCPSLPGCASQGETEEEALENIQDAIREYLEVVNEMNISPADRVEVDFREVQVA